MSENWIDRARRWMKASGTSQGSLARALDCTRGAVGHYLAGRRQPTLAQMERIARAMKVHPAWLLFGVGQEGIDERPAAYEAGSSPEFHLRVMGGGLSALVNPPAALLDLSTLFERCYGFRVEPGNSYARACEGEILVIDPQSVPHPGDEVLVGFSDSDTLLCELVSIDVDCITLGSLSDRRQRWECTPRQLAYMHRVIAVVRRDSLPMTGVETV